MHALVIPAPIEKIIDGFGLAQALDTVVVKRQRRGILLQEAGCFAANPGINFLHGTTAIARCGPFPKSNRMKTLTWDLRIFSTSETGAITQ
jgi:hypothetical protein